MKSCSERKTGWAFALFFIPVIFWIMLLLVLPHAEVLRVSALKSGSGGSPGGFFSDPAAIWALGRAALFSLVVTVIVLVFSLPAAYFVTKVAGVRLRGFLMLAALLPLWASELVRIYGWTILLGQNGVVNQLMVTSGFWKEPAGLLFGDAAVFLWLVYAAAVFLLVPLVSSLARLDDTVIEAAFGLGAKKFAIWKEIVIPWTKPAIVFGSIVVFLFLLGSRFAPGVSGESNSPWFAEQIFDRLGASSGWTREPAFGALLLLLSTAVIWIVLKLAGRKNG